MALSQDLASQLATAYQSGDIGTVNSLLGSGGVSASDIQNYWNFDPTAMSGLTNAGVKFASPTGGIPTQAPSDLPQVTGALSAGYTKPTSGLSGAARQGVIEGDNIETQISQLPVELSSWHRQGDYMVQVDDKTGAILDQRYVPAISDTNLLLTGLSMTPGLGTLAAIANTANAAAQGNILGAAAGAAGLAGYPGVSTGLKTIGALNNGDYLNAAIGGANLAGVNNVGGVNLVDTANTANLITALQTKNPALFARSVSGLGTGATFGGGGGSTTSDGSGLSADEQAQLELNRLSKLYSSGTLTDAELQAIEDRTEEILLDLQASANVTTSPTVNSTTLATVNITGTNGTNVTIPEVVTTTAATRSITTLPEVVVTTKREVVTTVPEVVVTTKREVVTTIPTVVVTTQREVTTTIPTVVVTTQREVTTTIPTVVVTTKREVTTTIPTVVVTTQREVTTTIPTVVVTTQREVTTTLPEIVVTTQREVTTTIPTVVVTTQREVTTTIPTIIVTTQREVTTTLPEIVITTSAPTTTIPTVVTTIPPVVTTRRLTTTTNKGIGGGGTGTGQQGADTKLSYNKVYEEAPVLNPLLFSLAGIPTPSGTPEKTLSKEEQAAALEEKQKQKEAPSLDLLSFFNFAEGGMVPSHPMGQPEFYSEGGAGSTYIQGRGDGTSDQIPAMVANSEYVLPADVVSALGNGSSDSGASVLDQFIKIVREHKHSNPPSELPPQSKGPLEYLASAQMKGKR